MAAAPARHPIVPAIALDELAAVWRAGFHAADAALASAGLSLPPGELQARGARLAAEVGRTERLLQALAHEWHTPARFHHLLVSQVEARRLVALPASVKACVFNLEGVLIGSAALHARAWSETFEALTADRIDAARGAVAPFNPLSDYPRLVHGRPRLEGVRAFLATRGIRLPEGAPSDPPGTATVHGLANEKNAVLLRLVDEQGVIAFAGARSYLELAREAGLRSAVISASANTARILERAGLADEGLLLEPARDALQACATLRVEPFAAAVFEDSAAGVEAARRDGFAYVVGIDRVGRGTALREHGADVVVADLASMLERA